MASEDNPFSGAPPKPTWDQELMEIMRSAIPMLLESIREKADKDAALINVVSNLVEHNRELVDFNRQLTAQILRPTSQG